MNLVRVFSWVSVSCSVLQCPGGSSASNCSVGTYSLAGSTTCTTCPAGEILLDSAHFCRFLACQAVCGTSLTWDFSLPKYCICVVGYVCPTQNTEPTPCTEGTYNLAPTASSCALCDAGSYCPTTAASPTPCAIGEMSLCSV